MELAPREPAGPANLALLAFQQRRFDDAASWIGRAVPDAPDNARIRILAALIERARARPDAAIEHVRRVADVDASAPRARFLLAQLLEQRSSTGDAAESRRVLDALLEMESAGAFLLVHSARHAVRQGDGVALRRALDRLESLSVSWPEPARTGLERVRVSVDRPADAGAELTLLAASLEALPGYVRERDAISISEQQPDLVITEFGLLESPSPRPAEPDLGMQFVERAIDAAPASVHDVRPIWTQAGEMRTAVLGSDALLFAADSGTVQRIPIPSSPTVPAGAMVLAAFDFDHDFAIDLAAVASGRLMLFRQEADGRFVAVGNDALPASTRARTLTGAWAADTDLDGDVDLVLGVRAEPPLVLRNRGDGTFAEIERFDGLTDARDFVWGDLDDDGVPDATFVDGRGRVHVFRNPRQDRPLFVRLAGTAGLDDTRAIALGDLDSDGRFQLLTVRGGALVSASYSRDGWRTEEMARWTDSASDTSPGRLLIADLDNNGALDVVVSAGQTRIWLADSSRVLLPHDVLPIAVTAAADPGSTGRIELLGVDSAGRPVRVTTRPMRDYYALTIGPRATDQPGDGRINTFGIGGEAEVRAGMLYQKQPITSPFVHFGIGGNTGVTVARILWPNGTVQAEFDLLASQGRPIVAEQRLKGSCPWLFAFDGQAMRFVTDIAWRTALGLRINAYGSSTVVHSEDWVRIRGDQLAAREGFYELSIAGELWESHFFDHVALMAVDHPTGTEILVDERFIIPPPELKVHATASLSPVAGAWDDGGRDVTRLLQERDERYVDSFELGAYQGVSRGEHGVEVDLGPDVPADAQLLLVAQGWVLPTDGSINFALGQGSHPVPRGLRAEVPDGRGGWTVLHADLGMPAGKTKTVLVDLTGAFVDGGPRRVRLRTNMEIYWDRIAWTVALPDTALRITRVPLHDAELRFRGFSRTHQAGRRAPELPEYAVAGTAPHWQDLEGYHTRFGDVLPLLREVDDRYVIMNAGDEMRLRFAAPPGPDSRESRDYVLVSDAWVKDGDYNNGFSSTLLPLPYHGLTDYSKPPGRLEDDPAFQRHADDWRDYHTRYVAPTRFRHALSQY